MNFLSLGAPANYSDPQGQCSPHGKSAQRPIQVRIDDDQPSQAILEELKQIQGLFAQLSPVSVKVSDAPEIAVAAAEFLLEGMYAHKRLSRSEERGFTAQEKATRKQERAEERDYDEFQEQRRSRRGFN